MASHIGRRKFLATLGGAAAAWPHAALAQQGEKMRRIGALMPYAANDPHVQIRNAAFLQGLQQLGWTVGQNVKLTGRTADHLQDLRRRGLPLQRLSQFIEQACVLGGDDGLRCEALDQLNLLVGERQAKRAFDAMMTMKKIDVAAIEAARRG